VPRRQVERLDALDPDDVDGEVARDRNEPGQHPAATRIVRAGVSPRPYEGLLRDILGDALVAHDGQHQAVDASLEATRERGRSIGVAGGKTGQKRLI
jgi:hypothetical protein